MVDENQAWMNFFITGKVKDYLNYCNSKTEDNDKKGPPEVPEHEHQDKGDRPQPEEFPLPGEIPYTSGGWPWLD